MRKFLFYRQLDQMDCGPACLKMIAQYYGKFYSLNTLKKKTFITREGVSLESINEAAENIGFRTLAAKLTFKQLDQEAILPCILHWNQKHFVVLPPQNFNLKRRKNKILIADPAHGLVRVKLDLFLKSWITSNNMGVALMLEPTAFFNENAEEKKERRSFTFLLRYMTPHKKYLRQILLGMLLGSILSLVFPFLTQSLVDYGINQHNIHFVYLILASQLALFLGSTAIDMIRGWLLLHMSTRINISIISDFLIKLMKLPIRFFDSKLIGDITQRVYDHNRIEKFLTGTSLNTMFSMLNIIVFSIVLGIYSISIFFIFLIGSFLSIFWIILFLKKRSSLDYAHFQQMSDNQNSLFEIISGMQDIKMNNSETTHRWEWERIQAKIFKINTKSLSLEQVQMIGAGFFSQLKNIFISFIAAKEVIAGNITLGMMLSISYIVGQINGPIQQLLVFFKDAQDARISLDRLNEIHLRENEESEIKVKPENGILSNFEQGGNIKLKNVSFQYGGNSSPLVIDGINLSIPFGKVTAIVGNSGSGKTTLMKLLLRFYEPTKGEIFLRDTPLLLVSPGWWRSKCGVVMSDGFIFSNSIERNITVEENVDHQRLSNAVKLANIENFIKNLPSGFSTKIGNTGIGISSGEKQRILIARAIYKRPHFIFLDEATSMLDANNERKIIENLNDFFSGRTVIVIAHRLSTVRNADQIIVMDKGKIVEIGNHHTLVLKRGEYFNLVKNQLELEN